MAVITDLGRVSLVPRGAYDADAVYRRLDIVEYEGSGYLVLADGVSGVEPAEGASYMLLAGRGGPGPQGEQGKPGGPGPQGEPGKDGTSFTVLGRYGTLDELMEAHPVGSKGDAWAVGSAEDNDVYLWDVDAQAWQNVGSLQGPDGAPGKDGADGRSAYQIAVEEGFQGTEEEWLASLKGKDGAQGADGTPGHAGADGKTAYQYAVDGGYTGTEEEFRALMGSGPWLPLEGGVMKGKISGIVTPIEGADAANKAYVDNKLINPKATAMI